MKEKNIENKIKRHLGDIGAYFVKFHATAFTRSGVPDILACINGRFVAIEVKQEQGRISPLQEAHRRQIIKSGGVSLIVWSYEGYLQAMKHEGLI